MEGKWDHESHRKMDRKLTPQEGRNDQGPHIPGKTWNGRSDWLGLLILLCSCQRINTYSSVNGGLGQCRLNYH